jgi:uncharacterized protein YbaP (TraB family)
VGGKSAALGVASVLLGALATATLHAQTAASDVAPPGQLAEIAITGERPGPRLWKVSNGEHVLWMLGTLSHVPRGMKWRSKEVDGVLDQSQELLLNAPEVAASIGPISAIHLYFQWRHLQKNPAHSMLKAWLPAALYARFEALKARFDPGDSEIEQLRPTFAALRLYQHAIAAAGLTQGDEVQQTVVSQAEHRHLRIQRSAVRVDDPSAIFRQVAALSPTVEVACLQTTVERLESDLPTMQRRAAAWAVGDVALLRTLPYPNQREACISALSSVPNIKALVDHASQAWLAEAEFALEHNRVSIAMRPIYDLLAPDGSLAQLRAAGYRVEGP